MDKFIIEGPGRLSGELWVHGAKNSTLPLLAATLLCRTQAVLHNCPALSDVDTALRILQNLGCTVSREGHSLTVDAEVLSDDEIPRKPDAGNALVHCVSGGDYFPSGKSPAVLSRRL